MPYLYSTVQVRSYESQLIDRGIVSLDGLLSAAFQAIWRHVQPHLKRQFKILVVSGKGYNGTDGLMLALHMWRNGYHVDLCMVSHSGLNPLAQSLYDEIKMSGLACIDHPDCSTYDICIDAILGIGFNGHHLKPAVKSLIHKINRRKGICISIDCPSGINADTGMVFDDAVRADITIMLLLRKKGLYSADAFDYRGELVFDHCFLEYRDLLDRVSSIDLVGLNRNLFDPETPRANVDKRDFGRVLVVGGNVGMLGAVLLSSSAASRSGVGHVTLCVKDSDRVILPFDYTTVSLSDMPGLLAGSAINAVLVGPGLGQDAWSLACLKCCLSHALPTVIDADALRLVSEHHLDLHDQVIITPHHGEAAALLSCTVDAVAQDRFQACIDLHAHYGVHLILKGPGPIVLSRYEMYLIDASCPGLAVAGSGDVLAGIIVGLLGQRLKINKALLMDALLIHLHVGCYWEKQFQGRGMIASDMLSMIPLIKNQLSDGHYDTNN